MAESTLSSRNSAVRHVIRCAECHELVPADRVRYREESVKIAAAPAPGRSRAGGSPIFRPGVHGPRIKPDLPPGPEAAPPPPQNTSAIERIPVCIDCVRRRRMGLYSVCAIAAICVVVAAALYSHVEPLSSGQLVAWLAPAETAGPTRDATETETGASTSAAAPAPPVASAFAKDETRHSPPIWQSIWDAATRLFASASLSPPTPTPASDPAPSSAAATAQTTSPANAPATADAARPADTPSTDVADAAPSAPPIWETQRKSTRKAARAMLPTHRDAPTVNAVSLRNNGYAALQQRHYREALTMLQQATVMGDAYAPMYIGELFEGGIGVPRDVGQASYWYGIAIDRGNRTALAAFNRLRVSPY